jgi:hypothetical protein
VRGGEAIAVTTIFVGIPWVLGWILRTYLNHVQFMKVLQLRAENNARMLDRFGSDAAFLDYLKSDAQQKMFEVRTPEPRMPAPYMRMLTTIQIAFLLLSAGGACLYIRGYMFEGDKDAFLFLGTIGVALGLGSLLSAAAAFVVARMWGPLNRVDNGARP